MPKLNVTLRRNMQQIVHCAIEALSVYENNEDLNVVLEDLDQAKGLIEIVTQRIKSGAVK